jgi:hypothetical protein
MRIWKSPVIYVKSWLHNVKLKTKHLPSWGLTTTVIQSFDVYKRLAKTMWSYIARCLFINHPISHQEIWDALVTWKPWKEAINVAKLVMNNKGQHTHLDGMILV